MSVTKNWACQNCFCIFTTLTPIKRGQPFCPGCGEKMDIVKRDKSQRTNHGEDRRVHFKPEEVAMIKQILDGKKTVSQVALVLGRTPMSVSKKLGSLRKERKKHGHV